jgi:tetratricopeptide (TPR) repeat protein
MIFSGRKKLTIATSLLAVLLTFAGVLRSEAVNDPIPLRTIQIFTEGQQTPSWKSLWDQARTHAVAGNSREAAEAYSKLFAMKPQLEQASWEYCQLLLNLGDKKTAARVIASLLERNPNQLKYLFIAGTIALENDDLPAATAFFGRVLEKQPLGDRADQALSGMIKSWRGQGRRELALAAAERLMVRRPNDIRLLQETAEEAKSLGKISKTKSLLRQLLVVPALDDTTILQLVGTFDSPEFLSEIDDLCEKYLERHPLFLPFRKKLSARYLEVGRYDDALRHLYVLADNNGGNDDALLLAGRVAYRHANRPDKALALLERYLVKYPDNKDVSVEVTEIRRLLAEDFLSIVENDGAKLLWEDLTKITGHREEIFKQLANLLETKGAVKEYAEVLSILYQYHPEEEENAVRMVKQLYAEKAYEQARSVIDRIDLKKTKDKTVHILRAKILGMFGEKQEALSAMETALRLDPYDFELCIAAIELAGALGETKRIRMAFELRASRTGKKGVEKEVMVAYLRQLAMNYQFQEFQAIVARFYPTFSKDPETKSIIDLLSIESLRRQGKTYEAEQMLRIMLLEKRSLPEVLVALIDIAIEEADFQKAKSWLSYLKHLQRNGNIQALQNQDVPAHLLELRVARRERDLQLLSKLLQDSESVSPRKGANESFWSTLSLSQIELEKCWLKLMQGDPGSALRLLEKSSAEAKNLPDYYVIFSLVRKHHHKLGSEETPPQIVLPETVNELTLLPRVIEALIQLQEYDLAQGYILRFRQFNTDSPIAIILQMRLALARGSYNEANNLLGMLEKLYPDEAYFLSLRLVIALRTGNYSSGLELWKQHYGTIDASLPAESAKSSVAIDDFERMVLLARLLWGNKQNEKALQVYKGLLYPSVETVLQEIFRERRITYKQLIEEKKWWDGILRILNSSPDIVAKLMEASFLLANSDNEVSKILAEHFALFNAQKAIAGEYHARKAILDRNYAAAELTSKQVIEEQNSPEGLIDLATIYGRVGKYRKEAQVYEALQNSGTTSPELLASIERSSQQLSPQNSIDVAYNDKQGRDGIIDLQTTTLGSSFSFTPNFQSEVFVSYANNRYRSITPSTIATGNSLNATTVYDINKDFELRIGGGSHKMDDDSKLVLLHEMDLTGRLDQHFSAFLGWSKSLVDDNVASLQAETTFQQFDVGMICDTSLGLTFGGDFRHRNYSDDNTQNRFHAFSAYSIYGETIDLGGRYDFQYLANTDPDDAQESFADFPSDSASLYWRPSYWSEHLWSLTFRHNFFGYEGTGTRRNSYYAISNAICLDDADTLCYQGKFDIFLEMNPHFLLKGNFTVTKGDEYEEKGIGISLHYRW